MFNCLTPVEAHVLRTTQTDVVDGGECVWKDVLVDFLSTHLSSSLVVCGGMKGVEDPPPCLGQVAALQGELLPQNVLSVSHTISLF